MLVIALGAFIILVRTMLGIPGSWQTPLLIIAGLTLMVVGFLLRGEALSRTRVPRATRAAAYSFVEAAEPVAHEQKEGITSLN